MKYLDEYRDGDSVKKYLKAIEKITTKPWTIMEICGGQTHSIVKYGLDQLLPEKIELVHGPGCPVCVTSLGMIDKAIEIASLPDVIFCSFGDMLRVPGSKKDLLTTKAEGADVRSIYSPLDALKLAVAYPNKEIVFFAVGFETTAPANAMAVYQAKDQGVTNFSILISHFLVPPAMEAIMASKQSRVQGFLAAGHVCAVMGYEEYLPLATKYNVPIVVTGFEPLDIVQGVYQCIKQLEEGRVEVENQYSRSVKQIGNKIARHMIKEVFCPVSRSWRGIGTLPHSGLGLTEDYKHLDALNRYGLIELQDETDGGCISGLIMQGLKKPKDCIHFGTTCKPERPLGAPMVSTEGVCSAYYRYARFK